MLAPSVRYMILCEDWRASANNRRNIDVLGLLTNINSVDDPPYPLVYRELCVLLVLTNARGSGVAHIECSWEETGQKVFASPRREINFGDDPLEVFGIPFRIRNCVFPRSGIYSVPFWYHDQCLEERPLRLR